MWLAGTSPARAGGAHGGQDAATETNNEWETDIMPEEPNFAETTMTSSGRIRASYWVPGYVGQTTTGEPTYIFREAYTYTFRDDASGDHQAWQWLTGVAAGFDRMLGERSVRHSPIRGVVRPAVVDGVVQ